jgi:hypothetical protein
MIAFNVRFPKASCRIRREAVYYAVYRLYEDHRNGKDTMPARVMLELVTRFIKFEPNHQFLDFITKQAYYHTFGKSAQNLDIQIACWWTVMNILVEKFWPVHQCVDYALAQINDFSQLVFEDDLDVTDQKWRVQRKHADGVWLQILLSIVCEKDKKTEMYYIILRSIQRQDEERLLWFILRELGLPDDRREYNYVSHTRDTVLHACIRCPDLKPYQLKHLLKVFNPQFLDSKYRRPSELLSTLKPHEHTEELLALLQTSEDMHEPWRRDLMVVMGQSLRASCSMLAWLDNELIRMIIEDARLYYR